MVALFVAGTFLLCVIVDYFVAQPHAVLRRKDAVRFYTSLGPCMADGGELIKKETK